MWKDWTRRNSWKKQLLNLQSLVSIYTCRSVSHFLLEKGFLEWSVSLVPIMALQLRTQLSTMQSRSVYWPHRATSCISSWGIFLVSCHCHPMGLPNIKSLCWGLLFSFFSPSSLHLEFFPIDMLRWLSDRGRGRHPVPFWSFYWRPGWGEEGKHYEIRSR